MFLITRKYFEFVKKMPGTWDYSSHYSGLKPITTCMTFRALPQVFNIDIRMTWSKN